MEGEEGEGELYSSFPVGPPLDFSLNLQLIQKKLTRSKSIIPFFFGEEGLH